MVKLTRVWINPLRTGARDLLRNPQAMKAAVYAGLPTQPVTERPLWRLDRDNPHRPALLVLTRETPSFEHLVEQAGWPAADQPQVDSRDYQPVLDQLTAGAAFRFRLTANPTYADRKGVEPGQRGQRRAHVTIEHQTNWLLERAGRWGITIPDDTATGVPAVAITARGTERFRRNGSRVTLTTATYEGLLTVHDPDTFRDQLRAGFGPAKSYGCGLLTVATR